MKHFVMLSKNEIKYIQSLYHKKQRDVERVFVAEGVKLTAELLKSPANIIHIYATQSWLNDNTDLPAPVTRVSEDELTRISSQQTPHQVLLVAHQFAPQDDPVISGRLTLVLDGIQDPGNMGTIIRIADWFGVSQLVCSHDCVDIYNPKVVQSTMGSIARVQCWYKDFSIWAINSKTQIFGAVFNGKNIYELPGTSEGLLVIGNESKGIREPMVSKITQPVTIPRSGEAESLNAAVAAGIILGCMVNSADTSQHF